MPVNKKQWLRLQTLLSLLRRNGYRGVNYKSFIKKMKEEYEFKLDAEYDNEDKGKDEEFHISSKTFYRDIDALKKVFGAPVKYDKGGKVFYLSRPNWTNESMLTVPGDMKLLMLSQNLSEKFMPPQLRGELANAVNALLMKREKYDAENMNFDNFQIITPEYSPRVASDVFVKVYQAWEERNYLKFTYVSNKGHESVKIIEPHILAWDSGIWYIKGFLANDDSVPCEPPFDIRVFALHRIKNISEGGSFYATVEDTERMRQDSFFNFQPLPEVELEFLPPCINAMAERLPDTPGVIVSRDEKSLKVRLTDVQEYTVLRLISHAHGSVRVNKPESLKETLRRIAQNTLDNMQ